MSASREKKSRQGKTEELSERQLKAQQEAAQAKRNTIIYTIIGVVSAVLVAALLIWNSGFFQNRVGAVVIGGKTYTVADMQYYYGQIYSHYYSQAQAGMIDNLDYELPAEDQMYDEEEGKTWKDFILEESVHAMSEIKALVAYAEKEGYKMSEAGEQTVRENMDSLTAESAKNGFTTVNSFLKTVYGNAMTKARFEQIVRESVIASETRTRYEQALTYTDGQMNDFYLEHRDEMDLFEYNCLYFNMTVTPTKNEAGEYVDPTDADKEAAKQTAMDRADKAKKELDSGAVFNTVADQFAGDIRVAVSADQSYLGYELNTLFAEWMQDDERKGGDVTVLEAEDGKGIYLVQFLNRGRSEEITADVRHVFIAADKDEGADQPTEEQYAAAKEKAQKLLDEWKTAGATEELFIEMVEKESADTASVANGGLYESISSLDGYVKSFTDWALDPARKAGDTGLVQNTDSSIQGWHIMYYVAPNEALWKLDADGAMRAEDLDEWMHELTEELGVTVLDGINNLGA
ncbi:MAG: peptidylprolyl isomerase [Oscillospiraceae bacterium]|nr:peptidylprolyl isomerase [Oscillospiraceae bacterium]